MQKNPLPDDLAGLFGMLAIFFFGVTADSAYQIGTWIAVFCSGLCGAFVSLGMSDTNNWSALKAAWFVIIRVFAAIILTMSVVKVIALYLPQFGPSIALAPVAFVITCDPLRAWALSILEKALAWKRSR